MARKLHPVVKIMAMFHELSIDEKQTFLALAREEFKPPKLKVERSRKPKNEDMVDRTVRA